MSDNIISTGKNIEALNLVFEQHIEVITRSVQKLEDLNTQYSIIPSDFIKNQKEIIRLEAEQAKTRQALQKELIESQRLMQQESRTRAQLTREKATTIRLEETEARQIKRINRDREREMRVLQRSQGIYNAVQTRIKALTLQYNELATKKALYNNLTLREEGFLKGLNTTLNKYQSTLKKVDADIQNHRRNVGNYKSAYDGLGVSIAQLTREAPAFAVSMQTGFLALSNNIPILADEIQRLVIQNKNLIAQGQPTVSVLKQVATSFFGFQSLLSLGVLLLTLYGDELVSLIGDFFNFRKELGAVEKTTEKLNKVNEEFGSISEKAGKAAAEEASNLMILRSSIEDTSLSSEQRNKAVNMLIETYPEYFKGLEREKILNGQVGDVYDEVNKKIIQRARVTVAQRKLEELVALQVENDVKRRVRLGGVTAGNIDLVLEKIREEANARKTISQEEQEQIAKTISNYGKRVKGEEEVGSALLQKRHSIDDVNAASKRHNEEIDKANALVQTEIDVLLELIKNLGGLEDKNKNLIKIGTIEWYEDQISKQKDLKESTATTEREIASFNKTIENFEFILEGLRSGGKVGLAIDIESLADTKKIKKISPELKQAMKEAEEVVKKFGEKYKAELESAEKFTEIKTQAIKDLFTGVFSTFSDAFDFDFSTLDFVFETLADKSKQLFSTDNIGEWADFSKEAIGSVLDASLNRYRVELQEAQNARDIIVNNDLASDKEKAIARRKFEEEERRIKTQNAKAERNATLIKIATDTAAGIISALAQIPKFDFGISAGAYAAFIGATGAAQAALVASRPIPKFAEGTKSPLTKDTLAWTGDGGKKEALTRNGKLVGITPNKPTLSFLPAGTEVQADADDWIMKNIFKLNMASQGQVLSRNNVEGLMASEMALLRRDNQKLWYEVKNIAKRDIKVHNHITIEKPEEYSQ